VKLVEEKGKKEAITTPVEEKVSPVRKAIRVFVADDCSSIKDSIYKEFIKPRIDNLKRDFSIRIKEFESDLLKSLVDRIIYGRNGGIVTTSSGTTVITTSNTPYHKMSDGSSTVVTITSLNEAPRYEIDSFVTTQKILRDLREDIAKFDAVTVGTYKQLVNQPTTKIDFSRGWKNLDGEIPISRGRNGYIIELPPPVPLD
jgi:hypothetical protein